MHPSQERAQLSLPYPLSLPHPNTCLPVLVCGSVYSTPTQRLENQTVVEV